MFPFIFADYWALRRGVSLSVYICGVSAAFVAVLITLIPIPSLLSLSLFSNHTVLCYCIWPPWSKVSSTILIALRDKGIKSAILSVMLNIGLFLILRYLDCNLKHYWTMLVYKVNLVFRSKLLKSRTSINGWDIHSVYVYE
jgi:hypothetical protein